MYEFNQVKQFLISFLACNSFSHITSIVLRITISKREEDTKEEQNDIENNERNAWIKQDYCLCHSWTRIKCRFLSSILSSLFYLQTTNAARLFVNFLPSRADRRSTQLPKCAVVPTFSVHWKLKNRENRRRIFGTESILFIVWSVGVHVQRFHVRRHVICSVVVCGSCDADAHTK